MFLNQSELTSLILTFKLGLFTVLLSIFIGIPLSWYLSRKSTKLKIFLETVLMLPIVLPPTVLGFYFLILFKPGGFIDGFWKTLFNQDKISFSFTAMVIASTLVGLPYVMQTLKNTFKSIGYDQWEMAITLKASKWDAFISVIMPQAKFGVMSAIILCFAQTLGHFGLLLIVGGNIPTKTKVLSITIYENVEMLNFDRAHTLSILMVVIAFISLFGVQFLNRVRSEHE